MAAILSRGRGWGGGGGGGGGGWGGGGGGVGGGWGGGGGWIKPTLETTNTGHTSERSSVDDPTVRNGSHPPDSFEMRKYLFCK